MAGLKRPLPLQGAQRERLDEVFDPGIGVVEQLFELGPAIEADANRSCIRWARPAFPVDEHATTNLLAAVGAMKCWGHAGWRKISRGGGTWRGGLRRQ